MASSKQKQTSGNTESTEVKFTRPVLRTILGIIAVICILVFSNWLVRATSIGSQTLDLTEHKIHTLTPGTEAILRELETPVVIRYYVTRQSDAMPRRIKNYIRKVDSLVERYRLLAKGKVCIEYLDPQPDTDAEDSANLDGIKGERLEDENLYFGMSISSLDQQTSIPFLNPINDTLLEYTLSSAIANVTTFKKLNIGIMTTLPLLGSPATQPGQQPTPAWVVFQHLSQRYNIHNLTMKPETLDPQKIPVILLAHPSGISPHTEYLIDQYLLQGGIIVACLDPFALTAPLPDPRTRIEPGNAGKSKYSTLPKLLSAWGIGMDAFSVIADGKYAKASASGQRLHAHLSLTNEAIVSEDEIITKGFGNLYLPLAGGFTAVESEDITIETLVESSNKVAFIAGQDGTQPDPNLFIKNQPTGKKYGLVMRLQGRFPTAFPDGDPDQAQESPDTPEEARKLAPEHLSKAQTSASVYLISDADFLCDAACFSQEEHGYLPVNNNLALLQNILDQCMGSKHLIGSRSRAATTRPFTIIREMETDFEKDLHEDVEKARASMNEIVQQLQILQTQKISGKELVLTSEQEIKIQDLQTQQIKLKRDLREKEKSLRDQKNRLYSKITWLTVASTPLFITLTGVCVWLVRRRLTRIF